MESIRENLKHARAKAGYTQEELATEAGLSRSVIRDLEAGVRDSLTTSTLQKLAAALKVDAGSLLG